ncbi:ester cyclase [Aquimarina sp. U1-2]|uniref:ester cyclase n=1 Tax=Aquimarina sp. U1-2 TaxID=2823141 RepID=UPI001AECD6CD|nr:ester cyclase [Aquimarina sp. U1-2]MBP2831020.1 ester cyclase [Aquimarina sp. U1-2]
MTNIEIANTFLQAYSAHQIDKMVSLCTPEATYHYVPYGEQGKGSIEKEAKHLWETFTTVMPDFYVHIQTSMETQEGIIIVKALQGGTLEEEVMGIPGNSKRNEAPHIYLFTFQEHKISHIKCYWDNNTIYQQLGYTEEHS